MNAQLIEIGRRRAALSTRAAVEREKINAALESLRTPAGLVDRGVEALKKLRANPLLLAGVVAALTLLRWRKMAKWAGRGWAAWRVYQGLRARLSRKPR